MSKTDSGGTTSYKRAGAYVTDSLLKSTVSSTTTDYTPGVSSRVSGDSTFLHSGIKNADEQTNGSGDIAASRQYDAFGNLVSSSGSWTGPFGYGGLYGYQSDPDHGLMLLGHRHYEADTGRFLTPDPIKDGRNWYGYCANSPTQRADSSGLELIFLTDESRIWKPAIEEALRIIGEHEEFAEAVEEILYSKRKFLVHVREDPNSTAGLIPGVTDTAGLLTLGTRFADAEYMDHSGIWHEFTLEQVLAHELIGHLVKGITGPENEDRVVRDVENAFLRLRKRPTRKSYDGVRIRQTGPSKTNTR